MTQPSELETILTSLKDTNAIIDPGELVQLIEAVGAIIDDLDLEVIEAEEKSNATWAVINAQGGQTNTEVTNAHKLTSEYKELKTKQALLKRLRRHYRLLNTKLNLITKPRGR